MLFFRCFCLVFILNALFISTAFAHRPGESYIFLRVTETAVTGRFETTLKHLQNVIDIDQDKNDQLTDREYLLVADQVDAYMQNTLNFYHEGELHPVNITGHEESTRKTKVGDFVLINFTIPTLKIVPQGLNLDYHFLFDDIDPEHRGLVVLENNVLTGVVNQEANIVGIFGPADSKRYVRLTPLAWYEVVVEFIKHGAWHIWIGYDHVLFIISLLLPSVMRVKGKTYVPVEHFAQAMWTVVTIITLFTISHSISLSLATLDIVRLPSRLVESAIAASIAISAVNNIIPLFAHRMGVVVFFFGLFHGFGFANVLAPLDLQESSLVSSLFGFNIGVELAQLAIIIVIFPVLYAIRNWSKYTQIILRLGSSGLIVISLLWFVKRAFDLSFPLIG